MKNLQIVMASIVAVAVFSMAVAPIAPAAFAEGSNGDAWGEVTSVAATNDGQATGSHASDPNQNGDSTDDGLFRDPGRDGLGNVAAFFSGSGSDLDWCNVSDALNGPDPVEACAP